MSKKNTNSLSTAKMRELGSELQRIRKRAGYGGGQMGELLGCNASTISRLENGLSKVEDGKVALYLARANATPGELDELVSLDRRADDGYQVRPHPAGFPDELPIVAMLDRESTSITSYEPVEVPRHLQIDPYIRDALSQHGHDKQTLGAAVMTRLSRYPSSLHRPGSFTFYISEAVFRNNFVNRTVMQQQLAHLMTASSLPHFHIHLVPSDANLTDIRTGFTFFRHDEYRPVLHHQLPTMSLFLENETEVTFYEGFEKRITGFALSRDETRHWIKTRLAQQDHNLPD
ncbi:helix-turn-helix domain-containing protein [Amycolatopsis sp. NPDC049868]|uniref:helix-turn-helix domain-containing protein n=1 Tax=Amycolatopsis sp. NPDC049868 TaxID=3363934 RepID=UPI0037A039B2